ncbi:MAG: CheR family methyltransferase [Erythrobacter sp.]|jgi:chemotaxis protein methyltransferase CheR|nr:CheR family methyltransferase [Erythrobacter sp.]
MREPSAALAGAREPLVPGISPQLYGRPEFERIAAMIHAEAGIVLGESKAMLAYSRLAPLLRDAQCTGFGPFLDLVEQDGALKTRVIAALTTNHTYFNREPHHFEHFAQAVRPDLVAAAMEGKPVRLWSAGCSSGQELWTLMMVLMGPDRSAAAKLLGRDVLALASDLADHAVAAARRAAYPAAALEAIPEPLRKAWVRQHRESCEIAAELQALVRFRQLNLLGPWPFTRQFDVIFCRNVMIYFDEPTKRRLVKRFAEQLRPGGYLYIGHSERVLGEALDLLEPAGPTIYRRSAP